VTRDQSEVAGRAERGKPRKGYVMLRRKRSNVMHEGRGKRRGEGEGEGLGMREEGKAGKAGSSRRRQSTDGVTGYWGDGGLSRAGLDTTSSANGLRLLNPRRSPLLPQSRISF
jgi:hypothetical protein